MSSHSFFLLFLLPYPLPPVFHAPDLHAPHLPAGRRHSPRRRICACRRGALGPPASTSPAGPAFSPAAAGSARGRRRALGSPAPSTASSSRPTTAPPSHPPAALLRDASAAGALLRPGRRRRRLPPPTGRHRHPPLLLAGDRETGERWGRETERDATVKLSRADSSARFRRTEPTPIFTEYSLLGSAPSPAASIQTLQKRVRPIQVGPLLSTKHTVSLPQLVVSPNRQTPRVCGSLEIGVFFSGSERYLSDPLVNIFQFFLFLCRWDKKNWISVYFMESNFE